MQMQILMSVEIQKTMILVQQKMLIFKALVAMRVIYQFVCLGDEGGEEERDFRRVDYFYYCYCYYYNYYSAFNYKSMGDGIGESG
ncbi:MAG: hypothetical protein EZS28_006928 [Streblomastix strix]|uniref:Uncharacterized protein n=1 Tax=Streblomastix strix TaxID=222440 RepID=A0A5J4WRK4_9EUKA|nr:MAG: hypothetical protein EZS28_006928 [Streblomastix strix]